MSYQFRLYPPKVARDLFGNRLTLETARTYGYTESGERTKQSEYVSRRGDIEKSLVYIAGKGRRAGQFYYLAPCYESSMYCWRVYLKKTGGAVT